MNNIKLWRERKGITQVALCHKLGITPKSLQNYEYGRRTPDVIVAIKMAEELDVMVEDLFEVEA